MNYRRVAAEQGTLDQCSNNVRSSDWTRSQTPSPCADQTVASERLASDPPYFEEKTMKINWCPGDYSPSGVVSFASWDHIDLQAAIRRAFNESPRERIVEIIIEREGIKAVFETKSTCAQ